MVYITGDECGLIKEFNAASLKSRRKHPESPRYGIVAPSEAFASSKNIGGSAVSCLNASDGMSRQHGIVQLTSLCSRDDHSEKQEFAALRANGSIQLWRLRVHEVLVDSVAVHSKTNDYRKCVTIPNVFQTAIKNDNNARRPFCMGLVSQSSEARNGRDSRLAVCDSAGTVVVVDPSTYSEPRNEDASDHRGIFTCCSLSSPQHQQVDRSSSAPSQQKSIVSTFCTHSTNHWCAIGGKDRDTVVYDINHSSAGPFWKAKNLPPHPQTLLLPQIWPTASCFLNDIGSDNGSDSSQSNLLLVGTAYRQIRIYDLRLSQSVGTLQRRPIFHTDEKQPITDYRITAICPLSNHSFLIGDGGGTIVSYDIRRLSDFQSSTGQGVASSKIAALTGRFVGPAGSVRQLAALPGHKQFACVGYDRMLRVYDLSSRKQRYMIYLKQRLNTVLIVPFGRNDDGEDDLPADDDDNDIEQEDNVQDYMDSENECSEDEDDIVEEMIDALDRDDSKSESDESDDDEEDDEEEQASRVPPKKRKRP
jgi:ribosome biogenesis protein NSA1